MVSPTTPRVEYDPVTRWLSAAAVLLLILIFVWALLATARGPSTAERVGEVEQQVSYMTCLLFIPIDERPTRAPIECQPAPGGTP